jgi:hypothetical protein
MGLGIGIQDGLTLKPIPGISDRYTAGSDGHIYCYSDARVNSKKPRPFRLSESIGSSGYPFVSIIDYGKRRSKSVHTLVCAAFHGKKPSAIHEVRHMDGIKDCNIPSNLRWGTPAENEADKRRHGTAAIGSKHGIAKLNEEAVRILRIAIPNGFWNPIDAAKVFNVDPSVIRAAVSRKSWAHIE